MYEAFQKINFQMLPHSMNCFVLHSKWSEPVALTQNTGALTSSSSNMTNSAFLSFTSVTFLLFPLCCPDPGPVYYSPS